MASVSGNLFSIDCKFQLILIKFNFDFLTYAIQNIVDKLIVNCVSILNFVAALQECNNYLEIIGNNFLFG
jgi:hypothetical protein